MALRLRQFDDILTDAINYVAANTDLTDFNTGSKIRTILEAAALEDEEQYFQIANLLKLFNVRTVKGLDLIRRGQDYGVNGKLPAAPASVEVTVQDGALTQAELFGDFQAVSDSIVTLVDISPFSGFTPPFTVRLGEGTARVEDVIVNTVDVPNVQLQLATALVNDHFSGERVAWVDGSPDKIVSAGTLVQRPATTLLPAITFIMQDSAIIANGNYESQEVRVLATVSGSSGRVGQSQISSFADGQPFDGALITNKQESTGGSDEESDTQFQDRIIRSQQIKTSATQFSIEANLAGVTNPDTGQQITTVRVQEDFENDLVRVFIDDGTGLAAELVRFPISTLSSDLAAGAGTISVQSAADFSDAGWALVEDSTADVRAVFKYSSKTGNTLVLDALQHPIGVTAGLSFPGPFTDVHTGTTDASLNTTTSIKQTGAGWTAGAFVGYTVEITSGTQTGQKRVISANNTDTITVSTAIGTVDSELDSVNFRVIQPTPTLAATVRRVELAEENSEFGQQFTASKLFPVETGSMRVYIAQLDEPSGGYTPANERVEDTDFLLNRGTGQVQLISPIVAGRAIFLSYTYYEGIVQTAQRILNGDPADLINLPGVRAQGIRTVVETPTVVSFAVQMAISAETGFNEIELRPLVRDAILNYINGLNIGDDVIIAELVRVSQAVDGVLDTTVNTPATNITIAEGELARIESDDILVT